MTNILNKLDRTRHIISEQQQVSLHSDNKSIHSLRKSVQQKRFADVLGLLAQSYNIRALSWTQMAFREHFRT